MSPKKTNKPNPGINCSVNTCHYYLEGNHCGAEKIEIQPQNAANLEETDCATFTPHTM